MQEKAKEYNQKNNNYHDPLEEMCLYLPLVRWYPMCLEESKCIEE